MSPYLFGIGMEYLLMYVSMLRDDPRYGFHPKCKNVEVISLLFVDDLLIVSKLNHYFFMVVQERFKQFSMAYAYGEE